MGDGADAGREQFAPGRRVQKARRGAEGQPVGIADAVHASEAVVVEELAVGKRQPRGVETRQVVLAGVGLVEVLDVRFQRLQPCAALRLALEEQDAVGACEADVAAGGGHGRRPRYLVGGVPQTSPKREAPPGLGERQPQPGFQMQPPPAGDAADRAVACKRRPRRAQGPPERPQKIASVAKLQLRQSPIGFAARFEALEALPPQPSEQAVADVAHLRPPFQLHTAGDRQVRAVAGREAGAEVGEVVVVAHRRVLHQRVQTEDSPAVIDVHKPAVGWRELGLVAAPGDEVAPRQFPVVVIVRGQERAGEFGTGAAPKMPELRLHASPPSRHVPPNERGVVVGRQVQVVGHGDVDAAIVANGREQEAAAASPLHRKAKVRRVENRHAPQIQAGMASRGEPFAVVHFDGGCAKQPSAVRRRTPGEGRGSQGDGILAPVDALGQSPPAKLGQHDLRILQQRGPTRQVHRGAMAKQMQPRFAHMQRPVAAGPFRALVNRNRRRIQPPFPLKHHHAATRHGVLAGPGAQRTSGQPKRAGIAARHSRDRRLGVVRARTLRVFLPGLPQRLGQSRHRVRRDRKQQRRTQAVAQPRTDKAPLLWRQSTHERVAGTARMARRCAGRRRGGHGTAAGGGKHAQLLSRVHARVHLRRHALAARHRA